MNAIKAIWRNGQIQTRDAVDWPEGCEVLVEPVVPGDKIGMDEADWRDDADALANWDAWLASLEPLELTPDEEAAINRFDTEMARYNIDAVRSQMNERLP